MSSAWFGSTETVGVSTKRFSNASNSSRCEFANDNRLSRFNVVGIQILRRTVVRELCAQIIKQRASKSYRTYLTKQAEAENTGRLTRLLLFSASCSRSAGGPNSTHGHLNTSVVLSKN